MDMLSIYLNSIRMIYEKSKGDDDSLSSLFEFKYNLDNSRKKNKIVLLDCVEKWGVFIEKYIL